MTTVSTIPQLLQQGHTEAALEALLAATANHSDDLHQQAVLVSARYHNWARQKRLGLDNQQAELNSIRLSMLELHRLLGSQPASRPSRATASPRLWAGLAVGLLTAFGGIWLWEDTRTNAVAEVIEQAVPEPDSEAPNPNPGTVLPELFAEVSTWRVKAPPFDAPARMTITHATLSSPAPGSWEVLLQLEVTNEGEGWHPVQLVSSLFLLEQAGRASVTGSDLAVVSIEPGETATVALTFEAEAVEQELVFLIRQQAGETVRIPLKMKPKK